MGCKGAGLKGGEGHKGVVLGGVELKGVGETGRT